MSDTTPNLQLPYILPDQAQKHVTHNEALRRLDALVQLACIDALAQPPASPAEGERYLVASAALGAFADKANRIACFVDGAWTFLTPARGWSAYVLATDAQMLFTGTAWQRTGSSLSPDSVGIGAAADDVNRLAVASAASLFSHAGSGHQLKINRASDNATGSLLFQTNYGGRGEIGMIGDQNLGFKISRDGQTWRQAMTIEPSGIVRMPANPACRASPATASYSPANGANLGFGQMTASQGGFALGNPVVGVNGSRLIVPANGLYLVQMNASAITSGGYGLALMQNQSTVIAQIKAPPATGATTSSTAALVSLAVNDGLTLAFSGTALLEFGPLKTEIILTML